MYETTADIRTVRQIDVLSGTFHAVRIFTSVNYAEKWITEL